MTTALITLFHPPLDTESCVRAIAAQVDRVILCDNSPTPQAQVLFENIPNSHYIWFGENLGLCNAFNRILSNSGYGWRDEDFVIFFDQDSRIGSNHVDTLVDRYSILEQKGLRPGCLGPVYVNACSSKAEPVRSKSSDDDCFPICCTITSSLLCRYGAIKSVNFWDENLFLDLADWDLCWRLKASGYSCWMTAAVSLEHHLGLGEKKIGLFRLRVGQPHREYYQIRDGLYLIGKPHIPWCYRLRFLANIFIRTPLHLIFLDHRRERLHYVRMGLQDFFRNIHGRSDSAVALNNKNN